MISRRCLAICALLFATSMALTDVTADWESPFDFRVVVPEEPVGPDNEVEWYIHFFENGELVDPDEFTVRVGDYPYRREVEVDQKGKGVYSIKYDANEDEYRTTYLLDALKGDLEIDAYNSVHIGDTVYHDIVPTSSSMIGPGDTYSCNISVWVNDELGDPERLTVYANVPHYDTTNATREGVGRYSYICDVLETEEHLGEYSIHSNAHQQDYSDTSIRFFVYTIETWLHVVEMDEEYGVVDLYVVDRSGDPVISANITIEYDSCDSRMYCPVFFYGTTNESGAAQFNLSYYDFDIIYPNVEVDSDGVFHSFSFKLSKAQTPDPHEEKPSSKGFDVVVRDHELPKDGYVRFTAYNNSAPWRNKDIHYIIDRSAGSTGVEARENPVHGTTESDSFGNFWIKYDVTTRKRGTLFCQFTTPICKAKETDSSNDGHVYDIAYVSINGPWYRKTSDVSISLEDPLGLGKVNTFSVSIPDGDGELTLHLIAQDDKCEDLMDVKAASMLDIGKVFPQRYILKEGMQTVDIYLPYFLPDDDKFAFVVESEDHRIVNYNILVLEIGEVGRTRGPRDRDDQVPGFEAVSMIAALFIMIIITERKLLSR